MLSHFFTTTSWAGSNKYVLPRDTKTKANTIEIKSKNKITFHPVFFFEDEKDLWCKVEEYAIIQINDLKSPLYFPYNFLKLLTKH